jgi:hypothetical protein
MEQALPSGSTALPRALRVGSRRFRPAARPAERTASRERICALVTVAGVGLTSARSRHATLLAASGLRNTVCLARITGAETQGEGAAHQDGLAARDSAAVHHAGRAGTLTAR